MILAAERETALQAGRLWARCNEDASKDGRIILTWIFRKWDVDEACTGSSCLTIGTSVGLLRIR